MIVVRTQFDLFGVNFEMFYYQVYLTPGLSERADHLVQPFYFYFLFVCLLVHVVFRRKRSSGDKRQPVTVSPH